MRYIGASENSRRKEAFPSRNTSKISVGTIKTELKLNEPGPSPRRETNKERTNRIGQPNSFGPKIPRHKPNHQKHAFSSHNTLASRKAAPANGYNASSHSWVHPSAYSYSSLPPPSPSLECPISNAIPYASALPVVPQ